jgi:hypothetical protein
MARKCDQSAPGRFRGCILEQFKEDPAKGGRVAAGFLQRLAVSLLLVMWPCCVNNQLREIAGREIFKPPSSRRPAAPSEQTKYPDKNRHPLSPRPELQRQAMTHSERNAMLGDPASGFNQGMNEKGHRRAPPLAGCSI